MTLSSQYFFSTLGDDQDGADQGDEESGHGGDVGNGRRAGALKAHLVQLAARERVRKMRDRE